jgi:hypothetical protein
LLGEKILKFRPARLGHVAALGLLVSIALLADTWAPHTSALTQNATGWTAFVAPRDVDPSASADLPPHYVAFDPSATARHELFVFLGGFLASTTDTTLIVQEAAANGFNAIGLSYPKPAQSGPTCQLSSDERCFEAFRASVIAGSGEDSPVTVSRADSINNQLSKLLVLLAAQHPTEEWGAYLEDGMPRWSAIRLAGHSEGGTHAALIARDQPVIRLCVFEAPGDLVGAVGARRHLPPWVQSGGATPAERIYGFRHVHTSSATWPGFEAAWGLLGLNAFGPAADVDSSEPPYGGSHLLTTDAEPAVDDDTPNLPHRSVVEDRLTPKTSAGHPLFAPVWRYACMS